MKLISSIVLLYIATSIIGQTEQLESENLAKRFSKENITVLQQKKLSKNWKKFLLDIKGYPNLSYDTQSKQILFNYIFNHKAEKRVIFNRILEWCSVNFGPIKQITRYKNYDSGRIILDGHFNIGFKIGDSEALGNESVEKAKKTCYQTYIFTIKENKFKVELINIFYEYFYEEDNNSNYYKPERIVETSIHKLYPITNYSQESWKANINLLTYTDIEINRIINSLNKYVEQYNDDYNF